MTTRDPFPTLVLGLAIGVLGSFSDDLLGSAAIVTVLQVALWIIGGVIALWALLAMRERRGAAPGRLHPSA